MKIKVQCKNNVNEHLIFDTLTSNTVSSREEDSVHLKGMYEIFDGVFLLLYKDDRDELHLVINNRDLSVNNYFSIIYNEETLAKKGILQVYHDKEKYLIQYDISDMKPVSTVFYSEEDEDVNFGLWLYLVLNSTERKQILISNW